MEACSWQIFVAKLTRRVNSLPVFLLWTILCESCQKGQVEISWAKTRLLNPPKKINGVAVLAMNMPYYYAPEDLLQCIEVDHNELLQITHVVTLDPKKVVQIKNPLNKHFKSKIEEGVFCRTFVTVNDEHASMFFAHIENSVFKNNENVPLGWNFETISDVIFGLTMFLNAFRFLVVPIYFRQFCQFFNWYNPIFQFRRHSLRSSTGETLHVNL